MLSYSDNYTDGIVLRKSNHGLELIFRDTLHDFHKTEYIQEYSLTKDFCLLNKQIKEWLDSCENILLKRDT
jgi:hypothetical protein